MNNQFKKYTSGVYCLESDCDTFQHGDQTSIKTRRGKEVEVTIWKKLFSRNGLTYYSIIREDGLTRTEWTKRRLERQQNAAARQEKLSDHHYKESNRDRDFLSLGEPIKVGHHSEKRHRKIIERANVQMGKSVEASKKAQRHEEKAATLEDRAKTEINLDTPECIELLEERIAKFEERHAYIKSVEHQTYQLSNSSAAIRRYKKRLETAKKLWLLEPVED